MMANASIFVSLDKSGEGVGLARSLRVAHKPTAD
jgi:hypothetical protein